MMGVAEERSLASESVGGRTLMVVVVEREEREWED